MRCAHDSPTEILTGPYPEEEFWEDLYRVTGGQIDEELACFMIRESKDVLNWIVEQGVRWQPSLGGTLSLGRTNSFYLGGGRAMLNAHSATAEDLGVEVVYEAEVVDLDIRDGMFLSATVTYASRTVHVRAAALVAAAGGFKANMEWLKEYWGEAAENFLIRGTPYTSSRGATPKAGAFQQRMLYFRPRSRVDSLLHAVNFYLRVGWLPYELTVSAPEVAFTWSICQRRRKNTDERWRV